MKYSPFIRCHGLRHARSARLIVMLPALGWIAVSAVSAQQAETEVFELPPFEVNTARDRGYTATSSLAGGRLSSDLRDTAAAVSVMTADFLADIGATSFLEAAKWAPNAVPVEEVSGGNLYNDYSVQFRSLGSGFQSRNYFRWYINSDAYNTARIEFARGPNSLVFGDAGVGGVANVSSIQAQGSNRTALQVQYNSFGGYRAAADVDVKVTDALAVRVAGVYQRFDDWRHIGRNDRDGIFLTATYTVTPRTRIRAEVEWGELNRLISFGVLENYSGWDGQMTINGPIVPGTSLGVLSRINADRLVYDASLADKGVQNWVGLGATFGTLRMLTTGPQDGLAPTLVLPSYKVTYQAPNAGVRNPYHTASLFVQHQFGSDWYIELAANYQEQERDVTRWFFDALQVEVNSVLPDGSPNPRFGELFGDARYWRNPQRNEVADARVSLAHVRQIGSSEQRFLVAAGYRDDYFQNDNFELVRTNGSNRSVTVAANRIFARRYASQLALPVLTPPASDPVSGIQSRYARISASFSEKPIVYAQGVLLSKWLENQRLHTLVGVRHDWYKERINERASDVRDPVSQEFLEFGRKVQTNSQQVTSFSFSTVYHLTPALSLFAGYAESFDPGSTAIGITGMSLPPLVSNGLEGGLKISLLDGRLTGSITWYENEQENARISGEAGNIDAIWGFLQQPARQVGTYSDRESYTGSGLEFDFTAMLTANWRLMFNLALPDTEVSAGLMDTQAYYAANAEFWKSEIVRLKAAGETLLADAIENRVLGIESRLGSFTAGRRLNNTFRYTANLFSRYFFTDGPLAGFSVGGGVNMRGDRLVGNRPGDAYDYVYAKDYMLFTLVAGYERDWGRSRVSLQLNVSNLFDQEIVRPIRYATYVSNGQPLFVADRFHVQDPRRVLLTVGLQF
jgi:outer membrane receptor for ferric coprogen and ferric-rhodotorulic acid